MITRVMLAKPSMFGRISRLTYLFVLTVLASSVGQATSVAPPKYLLAPWQVIEPDGLGETYYFYPDGVLVMQNPRRREFVIIARWRMEAPNQVLLFDYRLLHTTLSQAELAQWRAKKYRWQITSITQSDMRWISLSDSEKAEIFKRRGDLPDRTENIYWGLGTDESYARGIRKSHW